MRQAEDRGRPRDVDPGAVRVAIIEDHELIAHSLGMAMRAGGMRVQLAPLSSRAETVAAVVDEQPDVVLLDLQLGGQIGDGTTLLGPLVDAGLTVLVMTAVSDRYRLAEALEGGAVGYVMKSESFEVFVDAVRRAAVGTPVIPEQTRSQLLMDLRRQRAQRWTQDSLFHRLTQREKEVLAALCDGMSVDTIAGEWTVSSATVRSQVRAILSKLNVNSQLTAVALARKSGWIGSDGAPVIFAQRS